MRLGRRVGTPRPAGSNPSTTASRLRAFRHRIGRLCAWAAIGTVLIAHPSDGPAHGKPTVRMRASPAEQAFLRQHWKRPLAPQGTPPERFSGLERSLAPADCGVCHPVQFAAWKTSAHARSMGPGITGQLVEMIKTDPAGARSCFTCHAPLAEQGPFARSGNGYGPNAALDPALQLQGVVCASCHVRGYQRFGPPRRDGSTGSRARRDTLPHNGATRTTAYLRSEFCASCHQFSRDGFALNGKLLENTFEEWRASPAARQGRQCQDCHMPDRQHLWRGIHDPEMVKSGIEIALEVSKTPVRPGDELTAAFTIRNTGVGHFFPTYVTPRVVVSMELLDASGGPIKGSRVEQGIGRDVPLDLSREIADTRIPPGGRFAFTYRRRLDEAAAQLSTKVTMYPDHFYTGFFESLLENGAGAGESHIRQALEGTRRSPFVVYERNIPLT